MRGRNSTVLSIRIDDKLYTTLKARASDKKQSLSEYLTACLVYISKQNGPTTPMTSRTMAATPSLQLYNPSVHKTGDRVLVRHGKQLVEAIVPALDADGRPMLDD